VTTQENQVDDLIRTAVELNRKIETIALESGSQFVSLARTARRNRMMIWTATIGVALDILLTVVITIFGIQLTSLTNQLDATQTTQRQRALCPLYGIFLDSKSAAGRKAAPDPKKYDHAFEVIQQGYRVLGCAEYLKESGQDKW
jgi:hypothetical protein